MSWITAAFDGAEADSKRTLARQYGSRDECAIMLPPHRSAGPMDSGNSGAAPEGAATFPWQVEQTVQLANRVEVCAEERTDPRRKRSKRIERMVFTHAFECSLAAKVDGQ